MKFADWNRSLKVRFIGEFIFQFMFWMFFPFMAMYFTNTLGKGLAGILLMSSQFVVVLINMIGGYLADTYGRRRMILVAGIGQTLAIVVMMMGSLPNHEGPIVVYIGFSLLSMMNALYNPASQALIADLVEERHRNGVYAMFFSAMNVALVLGPLVGGILFFKFRFWLLLMAALLCLGLFVFFYLFIEESMPMKVDRMKQSIKTVLYEQVSNYKVIFQSGVFSLFVLAGIGIAFTFMQLDMLLAVYIQEEFKNVSLLKMNLSGEQFYSFVVAFTAVFITILTLKFASTFDKVSEKKLFISGSILFALSMFVLGNSSSVYGILLGVFIYATADIFFIVQNGFISKIAPEDQRGQYFAAANLRFSIGKLVTPLSIPLSMLVGFKFAFFGIAGVALLAGGFYIWMFALQNKKNKHRMITQPNNSI